MSSLETSLVAAGLSAVEAESKERLFSRVEQALPVTAGARRWFVPGRIEVLGKHTDYGGGRSLLAATERGMCVMAQPRTDAVVRIVDAGREESIELPLSADLAPGSGWANYAGTVVRRFARNFPGASRGISIGLASDLPTAAGLSSSSALVVAIFTALAAINGIADTQEFQAELAKPEHLAEYLGCVENGQTYGTFTGDRGVGTFGGSEDHTAILCSRPGLLACYRFCPVTLERSVPLPADSVFDIAISGVHANKTGAARELYNRASRALGAVLQAWRSASGRGELSLGTALRELPEAKERIQEVLRKVNSGEFSSQQLQSRFEQFVLESEIIIPSAVAALESKDIHRFGRLVDDSQAAAETLLGNQVSETIALPKIARKLGAIAASAFGAGFGGSVWALVRRSDAEGFLQSWREAYAASFPRSVQRSDFFITTAGPGMIEV